MPRRYQSIFSAGYLDPLLYARPDLKKWPAGMIEATNVITLPQGGFKRRPGSKYIANYDEDFTRIMRFRVGYDVQYLLVFHGLIEDPTAVLDVYSTADVLLTSIATPWNIVQAEALHSAQEADTMVFLHQVVAPHRLLRAVLTSSPLKTTSGSAVVRVKQEGHGLLTGDKLGLSGAASVGGITGAQINGPRTVTQVSGDIVTDSVECTAISNNVTLETTAAHGLAINDRVELKKLEDIRVLGGGGGTTSISKADLNRIQVIKAVPSTTKFTFEVPTNVPTGGGTSDGATGGGSEGVWNALDYYTVTADASASSSTTGGGSSVVAWSLTSLEPSDVDADWKHKAEFSNIPKFDFQDTNSPQRADEVQRLIFDNFQTGDRFRLEFNGDRGDKLEYDADNDVNATNFQTYLNDVSRKTGIRVEFEETSGTEDRYLVTFGGDVAQRDWDPIQCQVTNSLNGLFSSTEVAKGGSTAEPVWSDQRGWPRAGIFHQRRLWLVAPASRPLSVYASVPEEFYNFDVGDAQPSDAIDNTGQFDPIQHIVVATTGVHLLTTGGVVDIVPDRDTGGFQHPLTFKAGDNYGSTAVAPVVLAGLVHYVDVVENRIRQLRLDDADRLVSAEVSELARTLITADVVRLGALRNSDGDYLYVINGDTDDTNSVAVMNLDIPQQVLGWTKFETDGDYADAVEVGNYMYSVVARQNGRLLEKFDPAYFTDAGVKQTGSQVVTWGNLDHLEDQRVDVRGDDATLDQKTVDVDGEVRATVANIAQPCDRTEIGLPFDVSVQPTPLVVARKTRLIAVEIDVIESAEFKVGGYPVITRIAGSLTNPATVTGIYRVPLRGYGQRKTVAITQRAPQPFVCRALHLEAA